MRWGRKLDYSGKGLGFYIPALDALKKKQQQQKTPQLYRPFPTLHGLPRFDMVLITMMGASGAGFGLLPYAGLGYLG